jgi:hypothetical protein
LLSLLLKFGIFDITGNFESNSDWRYPSPGHAIERRLPRPRSRRQCNGRFDVRIGPSERSFEEAGCGFGLYAAKFTVLNFSSTHCLLIRVLQLPSFRNLRQIDRLTQLRDEFLQNQQAENFARKMPDNPPEIMPYEPAGPLLRRAEETQPAEFQRNYVHSLIIRSIILWNIF